MTTSILILPGNTFLNKFKISFFLNNKFLILVLNNIRDGFSFFEVLFFITIRLRVYDIHNKTIIYDILKEKIYLNFII